MENFLAYVTLLFKTHPTIYYLSLYVKIDARFKRKTDHVENGTLRFLAYVSRPFSRTAARNISLHAFQKGEYCRLKNFRSVVFFIVKNVENGT